MTRPLRITRALQIEFHCYNLGVEKARAEYPRALRAAAVPPRWCCTNARTQRGGHGCTFHPSPMTSRRP